MKGCAALSAIHDFSDFLFQFIIYLFSEFGSCFVFGHELSLGNGDVKLGLLGQGETFPEGIFLLVLTGFAVVLRPGETSHLGGDRRMGNTSTVMNGGIGHTGEDGDTSVARRKVDATRQVVPAGEQRAILGAGTGSAATLPPGLLPFMEAVVSKSSLTEVILDVALGDVTCQYGHLALYQVVQFFLLEPYDSVKFLHIYCLFGKYQYICDYKEGPKRRDYFKLCSLVCLEPYFYGSNCSIIACILTLPKSDLPILTLRPLYIT